MNEIMHIGQRLKIASKQLGILDTNPKNFALSCIYDALFENMSEILSANKLDVIKARENNLTESVIERLTLTEKSFLDIISAVKEIIDLDDPNGVIIEESKLYNGAKVLKKTVPLGVMAIIYESRPNVTVDAVCLAIKSGNSVLLRGSSSAINSNIAIVNAIRKGLERTEVPVDSCILIENTDRKLVSEILTLNEYIDIVIPRGGADLIKFVVKNSTVPVIETGAGNCHLFVDETADFDMALSILENGKVQRPSVCNSIETLLVHQNIASEFLPKVFEKIADKVKIFGCEQTCKYIKCEKATEKEYETEFLDYIIAVKVVENVDFACEHIDKYSTGHSECIVTKSDENAMIFTKKVDSACVYVNASTRFTDGGQFGYGAEIGISTQKIHARGPMGLQHLVSHKYVILGDGQIRG